MKNANDANRVVDQNIVHIGIHDHVTFLKC